MTTTAVVQTKPNQASFVRQSRMVENRPFDYIYDKNYHLSTQTDHNAQAMKARGGTSNIVSFSSL